MGEDGGKTEERNPADRFPRAQKPLLGRELVGLALRLLLTLVTANRRRDKVPDLDEASGTGDALRITQGYSPSVVCRPIDLPPSFERLLADADRDLGPR